METIAIELNDYLELYDRAREYDSLKVKYDNVVEQLTEAYVELVNSQIDEYNIRSYGLDETCDIYNFHCAVQGEKLKMLKHLGIDDCLIADVIKTRWNEYHSEEKKKD